ncbi:hypothetical protein JCM19233_7279 [Vibrio astriarenae]|nr:hypothetical protein JCM19233_7279 [Vibrio sp. C7]
MPVFFQGKTPENGLGLLPVSMDKFLKYVSRIHGQQEYQKLV